MASNFNINKITLDNNSESAEILIGNTAPTVGPVSADPGSLFIVANPAGSSLYINTSATTPGTTWTLFGLAGAGGDHQALANLAWTSSLHTGTAGAIAAFNGTGTSVDLTGSLGDILYHDGSAWIALAPGSTGDVLEINVSGLPSWATPSSGTVTDLQTAYEGGNTITTSAAEGSVVISGDQILQVTTSGGLQVTGTNGLDVDTVVDFDVTTFDVQMTGTNGFSIDGTDASNVTTSSGDLTLSATANSVVIDGGEAATDAVTITASNAAGGIDINAGTGGITIDAAAASSFTTSAGALTLDGASGVTIEGNAGAVDVNSGVGTWDASSLALTTTGLLDLNAGANMDVDVTGTFDLLSTGTFSIDGTGASNVTADGGDLTLSTTTSGEVLVDGIGGVEVNSSAGAIDIGNDAVSQPINIGTGAAARTITIGNATGATALDIDSGTGGITIDSSGSVSVDAVGASNVTTDSGVLTLNTTTSGTVDVNGVDGVNIAGNAGEVDITTTGILDINSGAGTWNASTLDITATSTIDVTGTVVAVDSTAGDITLDAVGGGISLDGAAASNFTTSAGAITIDGAGGLNLQGNASEIDITTSGPIDINSGAAISIDSSAASNFTTSSGDLTLSATANSVIIDGAEAAADAVRINASDIAGGIDIDAGTGGIDILTTGPLTANATGQITIGGANTSAPEVRVNGVAGSEIITLTQTSGESFGVFAGTTDPSGSVTADAGSLFVRDTGLGAELYQNISTGGSGTNWSLFSSGGALAGNTIWVDAVNGDDPSGVRGEITSPFLTIGAAIAASLTGDTILILPGTYPEEGLSVNGISVIGVGGWEHTVVGPAFAATQDVFTVDNGGYIQGLSINVPNTAFNAVALTQAGGTNSMYDIAFYGDGGTSPLGTAVYRSGGGKTIGANIRYEGGGISNCLKVDQGVLALEGVHVPQSAGEITNVLLVTTNPGLTAAGRAQMVSFNVGNSNVTNAVRVDSGTSALTPSAILFIPNIFNCVNAVSSGGEYLNLSMLGGRFESLTGFSVVVDGIASSPGTQFAKYRINSNHQPDYFYPPVVAAESEFSLTYTQERTDVLESSFNIFGAEQFSVGFVERGTQASIGRGRPFSNGMVVLQADSTGTVFRDVTGEALSTAGSFVQFANTARNILGTGDIDASGLVFTTTGQSFLSDIPNGGAGTPPTRPGTQIFLSGIGTFNIATVDSDNQVTLAVSTGSGAVSGVIYSINVPAAAPIVDEAIYFGSLRRDVSNNPIKFWGFDMGIENAQINSGIPISIALDAAAGTGYTSATNVPTTGGTGSSLTVDITATAGDVETVVINTPGSGYTVGDVITIDQAGSGLNKTFTITNIEKGQYVFEIWDGSAWVEVSAQATSEEFGYSYGDKLFERSSSDEIIRLGLNDTDAFTPNGNPFELDRATWTTTTITPSTGIYAGSPLNSYWIRVRVADPPDVSNPDIEYVRLLESAFNISANGIPSVTGLAKLRSNIALNGVVWSGGTGGAALGNLVKQVGDGVTPNSFNIQVNDSLANASGEFWSIQFSLPLGLCTAFPVKLSAALYTDITGGTPTTNPISLTAQALPQKICGVFHADPAGGKLPVKRLSDLSDDILGGPERTPYSNTFNIVPHGAAGTLWTDLENKVHLVEIAEIDVSTLQSEDIILLRLTFNGGGSVTPLAMVLEGVSYQTGKAI